ncbi:MAG: amidohydrolase family protein [Planctomycetes bacterium]|nr:amidohydrolase family protein [Planctomycetota bacterium]
MRAAPAPTQSPAVRIDAHQHFWRYSPAEYGWIDARMSRIARDFLPADLQPELAAAGIDGCIAVQARCCQAENEFLLALAATTPFVKGVVGWADLTSPTAGDVVAQLAAHDKLVGLRHIVQAEADDFLRRADFQRGVRTLARHGLVYDLLVYPQQLPAALDFVRALPGQPLVLDHLAKPDIRRDGREPWARQLHELGRCPHLAVKLSGLVTEARWQHWRAADFTFYLDTALDAFGPDRLLFGSDWPVCLVAAADYRAVHDLLAQWATRLDSRARELLFSGNATRIYGLA